MNEFEIIQRYFRQQTGDADWLIHGVGDDGAVIRPAAGEDWVTVTDTLVSGRHFLPNALPYDIGWKALAVNLSDLAAMGAEPRAFLLSITLPVAEECWIEQFAAGLFELAGRHAVALIGGDTSAGPLNVTITALGVRAPDAGMLRSGAQPGDQVWVTGEPGDAALALHMQAKAPLSLQDRLNRPHPRCAEAVSVSGLATAAIDISDGLAADLGHIATASIVDIEINLDDIPSSPVFRDHCPPAMLARCLLAGGDDYELCITMPEGEMPPKADCGWTRIGSVKPAAGDEGQVTIHSTQGIVELAETGYQHFS